MDRYKCWFAVFHFQTQRCSQSPQKTSRWARTACGQRPFFLQNRCDVSSWLHVLLHSKHCTLGAVALWKHGEHGCARGISLVLGGVTGHGSALLTPVPSLGVDYLCGPAWRGFFTVKLLRLQDGVNVVVALSVGDP